MDGNTAFNRYIEQSLKLFNYVDGIMIVNRAGIITYFYTSYPAISALEVNEVLGKPLLEVYPSLTEETSYILRAIRTGKSFLNYQQTFTSFKGRTMNTINSTIPISDRGEVVGAADIVVYQDPAMPERNISIDLDLERIVSTARENLIYDLDDIITQDPRMLDIKEKIRSNSSSDSPVLVYGRTGTGKELVVNSLHRRGSRSKGPFISQNCAAIPSTLLESILFGTVKGSFTGAHDSKGLFELAHGGTLFLDEINSMEMAAQAKLLRAIEEKKIRRLGDSASRSVDVRVIAAVNEDPVQCVKEHKLREDLYYRLCVVRLDIPPLRERRRDIPLLMDYFRKYYNAKLKKNILSYSRAVEEIFLQYDWPGNVRELRNAVEGAFQFNYGATIEAEHLPDYIRNRMRQDRSQAEDLPLAQLVAQYERTIIEEKYYQNGGSLSRTAEALGLSKQSLAYKMKKHGIH